MGLKSVIHAALSPASRRHSPSPAVHGFHQQAPESTGWAQHQLTISGDLWLTEKDLQYKR